MEKVINETKQISLKAASAMCRAATSLGASDALAIAGCALIVASFWIHGRIGTKDLPRRGDVAKCA